MSELLTTGQMIDRLKVGESAINNMLVVHKVTKLNNGDIVRIDVENDRDILPFNLCYAVIKSKWRILPNYVSFEEAMKAYKEGKVIRSHLPMTNDVENIKTYSITEDDFFDIMIERITEGKWSIVGDTYDR